MLDVPEVKSIYTEIQKKLYYMIPEKWESVYLYASITEKAYQMPIGEMFFYYFPKGIFKKNPVNVYEIPNKFNIDEQQYMKLVKNLYGSIEKLRAIYKENKQRMWTNVTISIENFRFKIQYNYEPLDNFEYSNYDRHIIWRYEHLGTDINSLNKKERDIIEKYLVNKRIKKEDQEFYDEPIYKKPVHNILNYEKDKFSNPLELEIMKEFEVDRKPVNNQILAGLNNKKSRWR